MFQQRIIRAAYRLREKPINNINLLILSSLFSVVAILSMLSLHIIDNDSTKDQNILANMYLLRDNLYLRFIDNPESSVQQLVGLAGVGLLEAIFIFLTIKPTISDPLRSILAAAYYIKMTLSLPFVAILVYPIKNPASEVFILAKVIAILLIITSSATEYLAEYLNFTCLFKHNLKMDKRNNTLGPKIQLFIKLIAGYSLIRGEMVLPETIVFTVILLGLHVVKLIKLAADKMQRYNALLEMAHYFGWIFITCFLLVSILKLLVNLVSQNMQFMLISFFVWSSLAYYNVLEYSKSVLLIKQPKSVESEDEGITYIRLLHKIYQTRQEPGNSILFLGLIKDHTSQCGNLECICKKTNKSQTVAIFKDQKFLLKFVETNVDLIKQSYETTNVAITSLAFYVEVMKKFPQLFYESDMYFQKNSRIKLDLVQKYSLYQIQKEATKQLNEKNQGVEYEQSLELFKQEKRMHDCFEKIEKMLSSLASLYRCNARTQCGLNLLQKELSSISNLLFQIQELFHDETISIELLLLFSFFYRCVLNLSFKIKAVNSKLQSIYKKLELKDVLMEGFDANLYSSNGCVLLSIVQSHNFGMVNRVSENAHKLFGYPTQQSMIGIDSNKLLPKCLREQHEKMVGNWIQSGSFTKINKLIEAYCCTYEQNLFKSIMRTQISVVADKLTVCIGIMKVDDQNYMIVNKKKQIDSCGLDFLKFINQSRGLPVKEIFPRWEDIENQASKKNRIVRTQVNPKSSSKNTRGRAAKLDSYNQRNDDANLFDVVLEVNNSSLCNQDFIVLRKISFKKKSPLGTMLFPSSSQDTTFQEMTDSIKSQQMQIENSENGELIQQRFGQDCFVQTGSSTGSIAQSEYSIWRIMEEILTRFKAADKISYPFLGNVSIVIIIIFVLVIGSVIVQVFMYTRGLQSFNQVIFANAAINDNMQLSQIMYNKLMLYNQYCADDYDAQKCETVQNSTFYLQKLLSTLIGQHIDDLVKNRTFFGNPYFSYEFAPSKVVINGTSYDIDTFQLMEYFIRSSKQVGDLVAKNKRLNKQDQYIVMQFKDNWLQLKRQCNDNVLIYEQISLKELEQIVKYILLFGVVDVALLSIFAVFKYWVIKKKNMFLSKTLLLFRIIPIKTSESLLTYYTELSQVIKQKNISLLAKVEAPKINTNNSSSIQKYKQYVNYLPKIVVGMLWVVFVFFVVLTTYEMTEYNNLWKESLFSFNKLLLAENNMFSDYFQLKTFYLLPATNKNRQKFEAKLFETLRQNEVKFVEVAINTNSIFEQGSEELSRQLAHVLIDDICEITANLTFPWESNRCSSAMSYKMLEEGLVSVMSFFQRTVYQAVFDLRDDKIDPRAYFKGRSFENLDEYLIYLLRMFQTTQDKMIKGLKFFIAERYKVLTIIVGVHVSILGLTIIWWLFSQKSKKKQIAQIYGYILAFPIALVKQSKFIQQSLSKVL